MTGFRHTEDDCIDVELPESTADLDPDVADAVELRKCEHKLTANATLPIDVVAAIAYRAGVTAAREGAVTPDKIHDLANDHVELWGRYQVEGTEQGLVEWVEQEADVTVDHSEPVAYPERNVFDARAEYHPEDDVPLHITLSPPESILEAVGWNELIEGVRLHVAADGGD